MNKIGTKLCDDHYALAVNKIGHECEEFSTGNQFKETCELCDNLWTHWLSFLCKTDDLSFEHIPYVYKDKSDYEKDFKDYFEKYR